MTKRIMALWLCLMLVIGLGAGMSTSAAAKETIIVAGSDFQNGNYSTGKIEQILYTLEMNGIEKMDAAFFCGDYTSEQMESKESYKGINALKDVFKSRTNNMLFIQGNHDHEDTAGLAKAGNNDPSGKAYGVFVINEDQFREWGNDRKVTEDMVVTLRAYLEAKHKAGWKKPIFILNHIPLHWSNRTLKDGSGTDADLIFDVLNEYGGKGMNIIYLYGHNHSGGYDDAMGGAAVYFKKGDKIEVCHGDKRKHETETLKFTYMNAGFIGAYAGAHEDTDATLTMSVFRIRGNEVIITRYDSEVNPLTGKTGVHNLKSKGVLHASWSGAEHNKPYTQVYKSSRKVTGTTDVYVATPMPATTTEKTTKTTAKKQNHSQSEDKAEQAVDMDVDVDVDMNTNDGALTWEDTETDTEDTQTEDTSSAFIQQILHWAEIVGLGLVGVVALAVIIVVTVILIRKKKQ